MKNFFISYKNPLTAVLAIIIICGIFVLKRLPTSLFPEITFPKIKIIADAGLQPVNRMMVTVTRPLENAIKQVPDLATVRSNTSRGSCEISAFLDWHADVNASQQRIESKVNEIRAALPANVQITVEKMSPSILPVMGYSLEGRNLSAIELRELAVNTIQPYLSQVNGVSKINIAGGRQREYWVEPDLQKMSALSLTPDKINAALSQTNFLQSNGYLGDRRFLYLTVTDASVETVEGLENIVIGGNNKRVIRLKDIATVEVREAVDYTRINANGRDGLLVAIVKQPNANLIEVSEKVKERVASLKKILPSGVVMKPYYIQADFVNESVTSVTDSLWIGLALAIIVAVVFLRSLKASMAILISIPITLFLTLIVLYMAGYTLNIMTLGAIAAAIGLIIDDAIVVVEQIYRTHEEQPGAPYSLIARKAISYLFPAMLGSSISTIVIFIPFMLMTGVAGAYFNVMTNTMIIALVCSFLVTWIGLPVIYLLMSGRRATPQMPKEAAVVSPVKRHSWISFFLLRPYIGFIFSGILILVIVLLVPKLQTGFLPRMDEGSIVLDYSSPPGTSPDETDEKLREVEKIISHVKEVQAYSRRTGTQMGFFITEPNTGDYLIQLKRQRNKTTEQVIENIRKQVEASQPALRIDFGQVIGDMLGDLMASVQPIEVKIFGNQQEKLQQLSRQVADVVRKTQGTADVFNGIVTTGPSVSVRPDQTRLAEFGLSSSSLQYQLQTAVEGTLIGSIFERERIYPVRLVYPGSRALTIENLRNQRIFLPDGRLKPVTELATVQVNSGDAEIQRENLQSLEVVSARLEKRDLGNVIKDIQRNIAREVALPQGYHIEYGGAYAEQQKSFEELLLILVASSLLVFGIMFFLFKNFLIAAAVLFISVLGIAGSCLALFITGTALNVGSYTGLIMIVGIVGENAIFTLWQFIEASRIKTVDDALIYSISVRLRPKLMTALGATIALLPLALGIGAGAELHQPLAIAVIGGFIIALPLLLVVLPSIVRIIYSKKKIDAYA